LKILENRQYVFSGFDLVFTSEIPIGGGVSSSSALCCGFIKSLSALFKFEISDKEIIKLASEAEYGMGLKGGLMDQNAIVYGQNAHILKLDCDSGTLEQMPFNLGKHQMILFDTNVKHKLIDTEYNLRREQGEKALKRINEQTKRVFNFRTITLEALEFLKDDPILKKRIKHVITEIQRVNQAIMAIECNNFKLLGRLIKESHESLQNDYEVSCEQLDFVAAYLNAQDDVLGARMMGGGFGGNVLALFKEAPNQRLVDKLKKEYEKIYKLSLKTLSIWPSEGLHMVEID
jgi:galactokinase